MLKKWNFLEETYSDDKTYKDCTNNSKGTAVEVLNSVRCQKYILL